MKLKLLKEHYQSRDGKVWTPKKAFNSIEEIEESEFSDTDHWHSYVCDFCLKFHVCKKTNIRVAK